MRRSMRRQAFTLIELLTVIAISGILITLIVYPLIQAFNLTRQGQALADAQDRARILSNRIASEIGNAVGVRDNTGYKGSITVVVPGKPGVGGVQPDVPETLPYAKLDIVKAAEGEPGANPGEFIDPNTGKIDPTLTAPKGQILLPVAPGATIIRYFIALRDSFDELGQPARYYNPYEGILMAKGGQRDNLFSLFRAEVQPYVYSEFGPRVNLALFQDEDDDNRPDDIDDPAFFTLLPTTDYNPTTLALTPAGLKKAQRMKNWLGSGTQTINDPKGGTIKCPLGRATLVTELSRFDMIAPLYDRRSRQVVYDNSYDFVEPTTLQDRPRIIPLAQFKPTRISNDPAEGEQAVRLGEEAENATEIAPDVFTTRYAGWTSSVIRTWPAGWDRTNPVVNEFLVGRTDPRNGQPGFAPGFSIYWFDPDSGGEEMLDGFEVFDVEAYEQGVAAGSSYPFTNAIAQADSRSGWLTDGEAMRIRAIFTPYFPDRSTGKLIASFGINEVGTTPLPGGANNLPEAYSGNAVGPLQDSGAGAFYSPQDPAALAPPYFTINGCFNRVWNEHPELRPDIQRFIDLRVTRQTDGTASPLDPDPAVGFQRARIVPGSEEVYGPDQIPGENYGRQVRYSRTTQHPGPNQYRINYVDQAEPDYTLLGLTPPPPTYDPTNFVSAVYQPRFKAGYIELNSDPNAPLPQGASGAEFQVFYRFQFTHPNDAFAVDYDSRQVMSINLTIRTFPQSSYPNAQSVALKTSAVVRNFIR